MRMDRHLMLAAGMLLGTSVQAEETFAGIWEVSFGEGTEIWTITEDDGGYVVESEVTDVGGMGILMPGLLGEPEDTEITVDGTAFRITKTYAGPQVGLEVVTVSSGEIDGDALTATYTMSVLGIERPISGTRL
jgi:hypothetical protein